MGQAAHVPSAGPRVSDPESAADASVIVGDDMTCGVDVAGDETVEDEAVTAADAMATTLRREERDPRASAQMLKSLRFRAKYLRGLVELHLPTNAEPPSVTPRGSLSKYCLRLPHLHLRITMAQLALDAQFSALDSASAPELFAQRCWGMPREQLVYWTSVKNQTYSLSTQQYHLLIFIIVISHVAETAPLGKSCPHCKIDWIVLSLSTDRDRRGLIHV